MTERILFDVFAPFGPIQNVRKVEHKYAFVDFVSPASAQVDPRRSPLRQADPLPVPLLLETRPRRTPHLPRLAPPATRPFVGALFTLSPLHPSSLSVAPAARVLQRAVSISGVSLMGRMIRVEVAQTTRSTARPTPQPPRLPITSIQVSGRHH